MSDYAELPAQLRALERNDLMQRAPLAGFLVAKAADAIEALTAERDALRSALRELLEQIDADDWDWEGSPMAVRAVLAANALLTGAEK